MTNAQMHADAAVRAKNVTIERQPDFKLKRFQNVEPRTSTKRGDQAFMMNSRRVTNSAANGYAQDDAGNLMEPEQQ